MRYPIALALAVLAFAAFIAPHPAAADDYNPTAVVVSGTGIQTATATSPATWAGGSRLAIQCPNIDGGAGQRVFYRPGGCSGCVADAGLGDTLLDFTINQDPFPTTLRNGMSKIHLRGFAATDAIWCTVTPRSP